MKMYLKSNLNTKLHSKVICNKLRILRFCSKLFMQQSSLFFLWLMCIEETWVNVNHVVAEHSRKNMFHLPINQLNHRKPRKLLKIPPVFGHRQTKTACISIPGGQRVARFLRTR